MRVLEVSAWEKRSKTWGKNPGSIPAPVSLTLMRAHPFTFVQRDGDVTAGRR